MYSIALHLKINATFLQSFNPKVFSFPVNQEKSLQNIVNTGFYRKDSSMFVVFEESLQDLQPMDSKEINL